MLIRISDKIIEHDVVLDNMRLVSICINDFMTFVGQSKMYRWRIKLLFRK